MLKINNISKCFENRKVLKDVTTEVKSETKVIIGLNGSGKSTLLKIVAGIIRADEGRVIIGERDVTLLPPEDRKIGYVPQHTALFNHLTIKENITYSFKNRRGSMETVEKTIDMLGLKDYLNCKPHELSGGYKSRVSMARALVSAPQVMLLDEPLSDIDAATKEKLLPEFRFVFKNIDIPVLYVTHDVHEAEAIGDTFAVMIDGKLIDIDSASRAFDFIKITTKKFYGNY